MCVCVTEVRCLWGGPRVVMHDLCTLPKTSEPLAPQRMLENECSTMNARERWQVLEPSRTAGAASGCKCNRGAAARNGHNRVAAA